MTKRKAFIKRKRKVLHITGLKVAYFIICKRKLWLFSRNITGEHTSEYVEIGKLIEKQFFKDKNKFENFGDDPIRIDFISSENGIIIHEVKKSKALEEAHIWQVKYYLWFLKNKGVKVAYGIIHYPKLLKKLNVYLEEADNDKILNALNEISKIIKSEKIPNVINKPYCKKCSYFYLCYV
jgi:CRISPR-associated exonuclease Cas4